MAGVFRHRFRPPPPRRWVGTAVTVAKTGSDTGSLSAETSSLEETLSKTGSDTATLTESASLDVTLVAAETSSLTEALGDRIFSADDSSTLTEAATVVASGSGIAFDDDVDLIVEMLFGGDPLLSGAIFTRDSEAYDDSAVLYAADVPRYPTGRSAEGILIEEGTTNLLTANQASVETDTAGFTAEGAGTTIARSTSEAWVGSASLQVDVPGSATGEGVRFAEVAVSASSPYVASVRAKGAGTIRVTVEEFDSADVLLATHTGTAVVLSSSFDRVRGLAFVTQATADHVEVVVETTVAAASTFYLDGNQFEEKRHVTSWHPGGQTRGHEKVNIPTRVLDPTEGSIEFWAFIDDDFKALGAFSTLFFAYGSVDNVGIWIDHDRNLAHTNFQTRDDAGDRTDINVADADLPNGWRHIALTWTTAELKVYVDGTLEGSAANPNLPSSFRAVVIGSGDDPNFHINNDGEGAFERGADTIIDDVRISSVARSIITATAPMPVDADTTYKLTFDETLEYAWSDVSTYGRDISTDRGRQHELDRIEAGTASVRLRNNDRRFEPEYDGSPYYPHVDSMVRMRVRARHKLDDTIYSLFNGFVERWKPSYVAGRADWVDVGAVDALKVLAMARTAEWTSQVEVDAPVGWWRFEETSGNAADSSGNGHDGTVNGSPTRGSEGGLAGADLAYTFDGSDDYISIGSVAGLRIAGDLTLEAWIYLDAAGAGTERAIVWTSSTAVFSNVAYGLFVDTDNALRFIHAKDFEEYISQQGPVLAHETWLHVAAVRDNTERIVQLYLNGELALTERWVDKPDPADLSVEETELGRSRSGSRWYFEGLISEIAVYDKILSGGRIRHHYDARAIFAVDEDAAERMATILDVVGWPEDRRVLSSAGDNLQAESDLDTDVLGYIRTLEATEPGLFYIDANGDAVFRGRYYRSQNQQSVQATFGDGGGELGFAKVELSKDDDLIINLAEVAREGGEVQTFSDPASITRYGPRVERRSGLRMTVDQWALFNAQLLVGFRSTPGRRIESITIRPREDPDSLWPKVLGLGIGDKIRVNLQPEGSGARISQDAHIEHISHRFTSHRTWETTWRLSPAGTQALWVLGDSVNGVLGETTRLSY